MAGREPDPDRITAWRPEVKGVTEVFHAHFTRHSYPMHVHDTWTLLIVDEGAVRYDLDRHEHGTPLGTVSLLPPGVPHNGSAATPDGFRKRVLYLDASDDGPLDTSLVGAAADSPDLVDPLLRHRIGQLHTALVRPGDELEAAARLALVGERLRERLRPAFGGPVRVAPDRRVADRLRQLLDARVVDGVVLEEAAGVLGAHPAHLVRSFSAAYGIAPHQYLMARRVDRARRLLLAGRPAGEVAADVGFYDQSHLTRHFKRVVGIPPARYARASGRG
ncbi:MULTISPECIES: AraC family transcriptional regulator [unclassified Streptomyces]|uniref:helix-turn-helix transcriptional regulator n=1 Tax=unclassified Streptomyces TaxID=2593676 RepID=UPI000DB92934|nr:MULTISPECIES: AraC family transcriptional regulator [unclassified Streptomyces]MYT68388.1 helix-turn-helix domain-containing protein [Streptomyces sp. SID8367]RAJ86060.1 AraC-like DNA-binding protein [Streptomyces sp. PsTaAH-137]